MIPGDVLLSVFIDANILFVVALCLWTFARFITRQFGLKHAYSTELRLLNGVFVAILVSPLLVMIVHLAQRSGVASDVSINLSDIIVSHYLNGAFEMKASEFERLLMARDTFTLNIATGASWLAWSVLGVFIAGLAVGFTRLAVSMLCLRRIVSESYAWRRFGRVRLRVSDTTLVPFSTRGIRNYYVVIPSHMLGQKDELTVSLAHEFQHLRQGDIDWEILLEALKPIFFLNPAYHAWKRKVEDLRELSCDSEVLRRGRIDVQDYCETLLSVSQQTLSRDRMFLVAVPKVALVTADRASGHVGKMSFLELRIKSMLDRGQARVHKLIYGAIVVPLVGSIFLIAIAIQSPGDWSQDRLMLSTVVNLERLDKINRLSAFGRVRN